MSGEIEAAAQLASAALAARELDRGQATLAPASHAEGACRNCGAVLTGNYCASCGQKAHIHRSVVHAVEEFLHGITHFDGKFWNTLPLLIARPGKLTRDYVMGHRARYVAPVATFLLTVFLMFFLFSFMSGPQIPEGAVVLDPKDRRNALADAQRAVADIEAEMAAARADPARADELAGLRIAHSAAVAMRERITAGADSEPVYTSKGGTVFDVIRSEAAAGNLKVSTGNPEWDAKGAKALKEPDFVFYKMKQKGYKLSFLLVPLSLPWLVLLFLGKRGVHVYDHVVFLLYSISFMSLLLIVCVGLLELNVASMAVYTTLLLVVPPLHIFMQLKEGYALTPFGALWRTALLTFGALITLMLYFAIILTLGLLD
jgi:hypothetical protein